MMGTKYIVQPGDTLSLIAKTHGVHVAQLMDWNKQILNRECIIPGEFIRLEPYTELFNANDHDAVRQLDERLKKLERKDKNEFSCRGCLVSEGEDHKSWCPYTIGLPAWPHPIVYGRIRAYDCGGVQVEIDQEYKVLTVKRHGTILHRLTLE
jgi:LysM domain